MRASERRQARCSACCTNADPKERKKNIRCKSSTPKPNQITTIHLHFLRLSMKRVLLFRDYSCQALFSDDDFIFLYAGCSRFTYVSADGVIVVNQFTCFATHNGTDRENERTDVYCISSMNDGRRTTDIDIKRKLLIVIEFINQRMERPYLVHNLLSEAQKQSLIKTSVHIDKARWRTDVIFDDNARVARMQDEICFNSDGSVVVLSQCRNASLLLHPNRKIFSVRYYAQSHTDFSEWFVDSMRRRPLFIDDKYIKSTQEIGRAHV